MAALLIFARE